MESKGVQKTVEESEQEGKGRRQNAWVVVEQDLLVANFFPLRLVVGVSCFYCSNPSEKSENARGGHRGLRTIKGACALGCICSVIKTGIVSQVKFCVYSVCECCTCKEVWWWGPDLSDLAKREAAASAGVSLLSLLFFFWVFEGSNNEEETRIVLVSTLGVRSSCLGE